MVTVLSFQITDLLEKVEFIFFPFMNPDGYHVRLCMFTCNQEVQCHNIDHNKFNSCFQYDRNVCVTSFISIHGPMTDFGGRIVALATHVLVWTLTGTIPYSGEGSVL